MQGCQPIIAVGVYFESDSRHAPSNSEKNHMLYLINKIVATYYKQYYSLNWTN